MGTRKSVEVTADIPKEKCFAIVYATCLDFLETYKPSKLIKVSSLFMIVWLQGKTTCRVSVKQKDSTRTVVNFSAEFEAFADLLHSLKRLVKRFEETFHSKCTYLSRLSPKEQAKWTETFLRQAETEVEKAELAWKEVEFAKEEDERLHRKEIWGPVNPKMVCPHCQEKGCVRTKAVDKSKAGLNPAGFVAGEMVAGAVGGLLGGMTRLERKTQAYCENCKNTWVF